jgi:hypothetical protein
MSKDEASRPNTTAQAPASVPVEHLNLKVKSQVKHI